MHIAYIHQYFTTPSGSGGTRSYEFSRRWATEGHKVTMVTTIAQLTDHDLHGATGIFWKRFSVDGIDVIALHIPYKQQMGRIGRGLAFLGFVIAATVVMLFMKDVDIVYATSTPLTVTIPALITRLIRKIPFVFEVRDLQPRGYIAHGIIKNKLGIGFFCWLEKRTYDRAVGVVALSSAMKGYIDKVTGKPAKTITVTNCSDNDLFKPLKRQEKKKIRARLGWEDKFVVAHAGTMGKVNGLYRIVNAASRIQEHRGICFVFIGEGREKPRLEQMVRNLNLNNVVFMNALPKSEFARVLPAADAGLVSIDKMPHMQFNCANKFFDTLACGLPVLLNYGGWQKDVLDEYNAGFGCDILDDDAFVENLLTLAKGKGLRETMGQNARQLAESEYDRNILAQKVLDYVSRCFAGAGEQTL